MVERVISTGPDADEHAIREQMRYMRIIEGRRDNPFVQIHLAKITKIEKDDNGRSTGRVTVQLLTMPGGGVRVQVLIPVPSSQYWFAGGLPPINTLVTIGWLPQGIAIILAYHMHGFRQLVDIKNLPELVPGELFLRAEVTETEELPPGIAGPPESVQAPGGTIFLDTNGDVTIQDKNKNTTVKLDSAGNVTVTASTKVTVNAPVVHLGGEDGKKLLTEDFLSTFNAHIHKGVTTGVGTSLEPAIPATGDTTEKTKAE